MARLARVVAVGEPHHLTQRGTTANQRKVVACPRLVLSSYIEAAGIAGDKKGPLFRTVDRNRLLTDQRFDRNAAWYMVKRRARAAGLPESVTNHTFRATGITAFRANGGSLEHAQAIAAHANPRTTAMYDHSEEKITAEELERVGI